MSPAVLLDLLDSAPLASARDLAQRVRRGVLEGRLKEGEQLPTIRELTSETGLSYGAVNRALAELQTEGLLVSRRRGGTIVASRTGRGGDPEMRLRVFGLISPELRTGYYPSLQEGFDQAAGQHGYQIIASNTNNDHRLQSDALRQLNEKGAAGVAIVPATLGPSPAPLIAELQDNGIPVVLLHRSVAGVRAPLITIPGEQVGELAGRHLIQTGHTKIAYFGPHTAGLAPVYERGLRRVLGDAGIELNEEWVDYGDMRKFSPEQFVAYEQHVDAWFDRHMGKPDRPTAIMTGFETTGEIAYLIALRRGYRIPEDLTIVSVGGDSRYGAILRRLACVTLNERATGERAVGFLHAMREGEEPIRSDATFTIPLEFDAGETLAPPDRDGLIYRHTHG